MDRATAPAEPSDEAGVLAELVALLRLEPLRADRFLGPSQDLGWGTVFGGQVLGQALFAASHTVADDRPVHSVHAMFLRPGDVQRPVEYEVDRSRDGASFSSRRVEAIQGGLPILHAMAGFHAIERGFEHQDPMPAMPGPQGLRSEAELAERLALLLPPAFAEKVRAPRPIEIRPIDPVDPLRPRPRPATRSLWLRAAARLPDDPVLHAALLAYASDFHFLTTALQPHAVSWMTPGIQVASLDHAMWFHRPFRVDEWLLYVVDGPSTSGSRGLVRGQVFDQNGALVASVAQEGLLRDRRGKGAAPASAG